MNKTNMNATNMDAVDPYRLIVYRTWSHEKSKYRWSWVLHDTNLDAICQSPKYYDTEYEVGIAIGKTIEIFTVDIKIEN